MTVPALLLGRKAALAATAICSVVLVGLAIGVYANMLDPADAFSADAIQHLALLQAEGAALPQVERALAALRLQAKSQPGLLQGDSDALAQSALQSELKSIVEINGGEVRSAYALPATSDAGLSLLSVQYDLTLPVNKLRGLVYAIESHAPYLFLSAADRHRPDRRHH